MSPHKRPSAEKLKGYIVDLPDLCFDGAKVNCSVCNIPLLCWNKTDFERHINSERHSRAKSAKRDEEQFQFELCVVLIVCNIPFRLLQKGPFVSFWNKYALCKLPSRRSIQRLLPFVREHIEKKTKSELKDKKLWLCVDETTDRQKHSVVNVMVRTMEPYQSSSAFLLASKRVVNCTADEILKVVLDSFNKFEISTNQLLMFMTDGAANMLSLGRSLKNHCGNLLHVTCKIHALHLVAQTIPTCYPVVNSLIANTKTVFLKSPKRTRLFHKLCPDIPEPPEPIVTRWGTWLQAAFYYYKYFDQVKNVILKLDKAEAAAIKKCQEIFQDNQVKIDLETIHNNYVGLAEGIEKLQDVSMSLVDSLQIVDDVHAQLSAVEDEKNMCVIRKLETVLGKNSDFLILRQICEGACENTFTCFKDNFKYANITSVDVERSFSALKNIYSARRCHLSETNLETYLMVTIFNRCYPV